MTIYPTLEAARADRLKQKLANGQHPTNIIRIKHSTGEGYILTGFAISTIKFFKGKIKQIEAANNIKMLGDEDIRTPQDQEADARRDAERKIIEANTVSIYLSSRGWGDYSSLNWVGDIRKADADILAESRDLLANGHDVDTPHISDADILTKINEARKKNAAPKKQYVAPTYGPGYCHNCKSYCFGDCGDYAPARTTKHDLDDAREANREANYGIND